MKYEVMMLRDRYETIEDALEAFKGLTLPYQEAVIREAIRWEMPDEETAIPDAVTMFIARTPERGAEFLRDELFVMMEIACDTGESEGTARLRVTIINAEEDD